LIGEVCIRSDLLVGVDPLLKTGSMNVDPAPFIATEAKAENEKSVRNKNKAV
jgi:hypothetical protein